MTADAPQPTSQNLDVVSTGAENSYYKPLLFPHTGKYIK